MKIPFLSFGFHDEIRTELQNASNRVIDSGWFINGNEVTAFEEEWSQYLGCQSSIGVSNGLDALILSLKALGIGSGDEVIVPSNTYVATALAATHVGATPVFVEPNKETYNIEPERIEAAISNKTTAIMPVHLYGHPADMVAISRIAADHGLVVIEDAAEAHGAAIGTKRVGGFGACAAFSFYANKCLTTGEGGMITTNDPALAAKLRHLRDHAMSPDRRYWHDVPGFNYRMTNLQAALGCAQMTRAKALLDHRRRLFAAYSAALGDVPGVRLNRTAPGAQNAYWMICLEVAGHNAAQRDALADRLRHRGIDTRPYFHPMSAMPFLPDADTPNAHIAAQQGLNLPTYADLSDTDVAEICAILRDEVTICA